MRVANTLAAVLVSALASALIPSLAIAAEAGKPLKVLCIAGGGWHDYAAQSQILKQGIEARVRSQVDVAYSPEPSGKATFDIYGNPDWAEGYDVVIHDECSCDVIDPAYIERILAAHRRGTPAVNLHCAMHSYRRGDVRQLVKAGADNAAWYEMIGLQSTGHGPQLPIEVTFTDRAHPITKPLADWKTINEELYNTVQVLPTAKVLASGRQVVPPKPKPGAPADPAAQPTEATSAVVWVNEYGPNKTRIFSTSLGHNNGTVADGRYLDLVARGLLWAAGRLDDDGTPAAGLEVSPTSR
ncbi:MAG: ThuA domain-containing protein [Planctomycetia bacterium]|jgi:type 1 glutamine amidotransferase